MSPAIEPPRVFAPPRVVEAADPNEVLREQLDDLIDCSLQPLKASEAELDRLARVRRILMEPLTSVIYRPRARKLTKRRTSR
jgi:hypothetical protein